MRHEAPRVCPEGEDGRPEALARLPEQPLVVPMLLVLLRCGRGRPQQAPRCRREAVLGLGVGERVDQELQEVLGLRLLGQHQGQQGVG